MIDITYTLTTDPVHYKQILQLQAANHKSVVSESEMVDQGFVTVKHDMELLTLIAGDKGHTVALCEDKVVGYALTMLKEHSDKIDILKPMFEVINSSTYKGVDLKSSPYVSMGQVCVSKDQRGRGVFRGLYNSMADSFRSSHTHIITEVDPKNTRSIRAHQKIGFDVLHANPEWEIIVLPL